MSAVPEDAYRAAWKVIMSGGTLQAALEAAAPLMLAAERERISEGLAAITVILSRPALGYRQSEEHRVVPLVPLRTLIAAAASGGDGAGRPQDGPSTVRTVPGGSGTPPDGSEPAETATAP